MPQCGAQVKSGRRGCRLGSKFFLNVSQGGLNTCTQIQTKYFPEPPRREKLWRVQLGGGALWREPRSGSASSPTAQVTAVRQDPGAL